MKKLLITGGAGFIGSHTVDKSIQLGYQVTVIDDLSRGNREYVHPDAKFVEMDIRSNKLPDLVRKEKFEFIIHLAAQIDVQTSNTDPIYDASVNILGTLNVLEAGKNTSVKKIVYASSAAVYGDPQSLPIEENHSLAPESGYGVSKQVPEKYFPIYKQLYGLDYTIFRYSNVYGPRQDAGGEGGVVARFIDRLLKNEAPVIYGDGEQTRDFIYVGDVVNANLLALERGSGQIMNLSTGQAVSVNHLYQTLAEILRFKKKPGYEEAKPGEIRHSCLDNRLAESILSWKAEVQLKQGLEMTLIHQEELHKAKKQIAGTLDE